MTKKEIRTGYKTTVVPSTVGHTINGKRTSLLVPNGWWMASGRVMLAIPPDVSFRDHRDVVTHQEGIRLLGRYSHQVQRFIRSVGFERMLAPINIDCLAMDLVWISPVPFGVCVNSLTADIHGGTQKGNFHFLLPRQIHNCEPGQEVPIPKETMPTVFSYDESRWVNLVHLAEVVGLTPLETVQSFLQLRAVALGQVAYVYDALQYVGVDDGSLTHGDGIAPAKRFLNAPEEGLIERSPNHVWVTLPVAERVLRLHLLGLKSAKDAVSF